MAQRSRSGRLASGDQFADRFTEALAARGMTMVTLQARLTGRGHRTSAATLSYWKTGKRQPEGPASLDAITEIEDILDLQPGELSGRIGPSRRRTPRPPAVEPGLSVPPTNGFTEALATLDLTNTVFELEDISLHTTVDVSATGVITRKTDKRLVRAKADSVNRTFIAIFGSEPIPAPVLLDQVNGVRVGESIAKPEIGLFLWELILPRALSIGETAVFETSLNIIDLGNEGEMGYYHHVETRTGEVLVWVRFDPKQPPTNCVQRIQWTLDQDPVTTPLDMSEIHTAHVGLSSFGPGLAGFEWDYDD